MIQETNKLITIRVARILSGLEAKDVARKIEIPYRKLLEYERNSEIMPISIVTKLLKIYEFHIDSIQF